MPDTWNDPLWAELVTRSEEGYYSEWRSHEANGEECCWDPNVERDDEPTCVAPATWTERTVDTVENEWCAHHKDLWVADQEIITDEGGSYL